MIAEKFVDIPKYEGLYQVSNLGNVKSLPKGDGNGNRERLLKQEIVRTKQAKYNRVSLSKNGKVTRYFVHRLVALLFIQNPENKPQVNHIDCNGQNNTVTNLEWVTGKENMKHSANLGKQDKPREMGCIRASELHQDKAVKKYSQLLGNRFITTYTVKRFGYSRRIVEYICVCGNTYKVLSTYTSVTARNGICNQCKDDGSVDYVTDLDLPQ